MSFDPVAGSDKIRDDYIGYLQTTFFINDKEYMDKFANRLKSDGLLSKGPYIDVTDSFETGKSMADLIEENIASRDFYSLDSESFPVKRSLYSHQETAFRHIINDNNAVITTGTGSGKTESFLIPVINYLMREKEVNHLTDGVRALIIYPMNALANDQMKRLRSLLKNYPYITFGTYTGETEETQKSVKEQFCDCGEKYVNYITETSASKPIKRCMCCDYVNNVNGILRDFYVGQDAATGVAATSLYNVIPSSIKEIPKNTSAIDDEFDFGFDEIEEEQEKEITKKLTKQYLVFSDSRQQAAYFASYFDGTYHNILRRRLLINVLKNNSERYRNGVSIKRLCDDLFAEFDKYRIFDEEDREKEAVKTV